MCCKPTYTPRLVAHARQAALSVSSILLPRAFCRRVRYSPLKNSESDMRYSSRKSTTVCGYVPQCAKRLVGKLVQCLSPERALALLSAALAAACFAAEASYLSGSDGDQASTVALFVCGAFFACASAYSQCCLTRRPRIVYREPHQRVDFVSKEGGLAWVPAAAPQLCRDDFAHPPKGRWFRDNAGRPAPKLVAPLVSPTSEPFGLEFIDAAALRVRPRKYS